MAEIEQIGGAVAAIEKGYYQQLIDEEAYRKHQRIADGEDIVVGVNAFRDEDEPSTERFDVPAQLEPAQRELLAALRARRDQAAVDASLAALAETAAGRRRPDAADRGRGRVDATLGEVCGALRDVFGSFRPGSAAAI